MERAGIAPQPSSPRPAKHGWRTIRYTTGSAGLRRSQHANDRAWHFQVKATLTGDGLVAAYVRSTPMPYSAISTACDWAAGPASGRSSIMIMQTEAQASIAVAAAKT